MIDYAIDVLTQLLIKQDFEDKKNNKITYVKKTRAYKDVIELIKTLKDNDILKQDSIDNTKMV